MDISLCREVCEKSGGYAEALLLVLVLVRAVWAEVKRRTLAKENSGLREEKASLHAQVQQLSVPPPAWRLESLPAIEVLGVAPPADENESAPTPELDPPSGSEGKGTPQR